MYDTVEYARSRLNDTVIMYQGNPFLVQTITRREQGGKLVVVGMLIEREAPMEVFLEDCDIKPVSLGYVNYNKKAFYTMRMPMRRDWKQGLRYLNLIDVDGRQFNGVGYSVFVNTIKNHYPSFQNAVKSLSNCRSMAFHRDFCIDENYNIIYKGLFTVAKYEEGDIGSFTIQKEWIREALDEAVGA